MIFPDMDKIGIGDPSIIWKVNLMEFIRTILPTIIMNGLKKIRRREKPTKRAGTRGQGMVKTQLEVVEVGKASLYPHRFSLNCSLIVECNRLIYNNNNCTLKLVKIGV